MIEKSSGLYSSLAPQFSKLNSLEGCCDSRRTFSPRFAFVRVKPCMYRSLQIVYANLKFAPSTQESDGRRSTNFRPSFHLPTMPLSVNPILSTARNTLATVKTHLPLPSVPALARIPRYPVNFLSKSLFLQTKYQPFAGTFNELTGSVSNFRGGILNSFSGKTDDRVFRTIRA
jgi:hypothetical protein